MGNYGFYKYETVAQKRAKVSKNIAKLKKKNPDIVPVTITGRKLAKSWWATAWNNNLESYSDYSNRIGRGRSYVRNGAVVDLRITPGNVSALVQGTRAKPYKVEVVINPLEKSSWKKLIKACQGKINSLQELIEGKFPKELNDLFTKQRSGLFPAPEEISFECSCPDWAVMCKHAAATLYGIGARFDEDPTLFFTLRNVDVDKLISEAVMEKTEILVKKSNNRSKRAMQNTDISEMFGIEMDESNTEK